MMAEGEFDNQTNTQRSFDAECEIKSGFARSLCKHCRFAMLPSNLSQVATFERLMRRFPDVACTSDIAETLRLIRNAETRCALRLPAWDFDRRQAVSRGAQIRASK
jgi:hypothetical protein